MGKGAIGVRSDLNLDRTMTQRSTYTGSCHCGRVAFELDAQLDHVVACSCSLCRKVGALWHGATDANLRITAGEDELTLYQFNTMTAQHCLRGCRHCGVHPFSRPRLSRPGGSSTSAASTVSTWPRSR